MESNQPNPMIYTSIGHSNIQKPHPSPFIPPNTAITPHGDPSKNVLSPHQMNLFMGKGIPNLQKLRY